MRKESLIFSIFRIIISAAFVALLAMLYWSSLLLEERWRTVNDEVIQISSEIVGLKEQIELLGAKYEQQKTSQPNVEQSQEKNRIAPEEVSSRPNISANFPNLLEEDPFFAKTLPALLGKNFAPYGDLRTATFGKPENLHPFAAWADLSEWWGLCSLSVAKAKEGIFETLAPNMAIKIEARPMKDHPTVSEFWVHLRDNVFWRPLNPSHFPNSKLAPHFLKKHQVTAYDFKLFYDLVMNSSVQQTGALALRGIYIDLEQIEVVDKLTFIVRWKPHRIDGKEKIIYAAKQRTGSLMPLASFVYNYYVDGSPVITDEEKSGNIDIFRTSSLFGQNFNDHWSKNTIISCGPYTFDGMSERMVRFKRNPEFFAPLAALVKRRDVMLKNSSDAAWQSFKAGELDLHLLGDSLQRQEWEDFLLTPAYLSQKERGFAAKRLDYLGRSYAFIGWNMARPLFASARIRQALTMAIDRQRIVRQNLNGMGEVAVGPFLPGSPASDSSLTPWPYDPLRARNLLEMEGWSESQGDGILYKEISGVLTPFRFKLSYFVKNLQTKAICEYVATALRQIGVACELSGVDLADLSSLLNDKDFDAFFLAWGLVSPPEDPRQLWHGSGAKEKGSSNQVGFDNKEADAIIEALDYESDQEKRAQLYHRFEKIVYDQCPYTFLYIPKSALVYREKVQNVFILSDEQKLLPGANISEPDPAIYWLKP